MKKKVLISTILAGCLGLLIVQWLTPSIWGADGYLHIRMADMVKTQGFLKTLPQARFSYFADRFSDKDFLYHLFLIPFTLFKNIFVGAKWAAWLGGCFLYASLMIIAGYYVKPVLLPLIGLMPFLSPNFLWTISRPRPMVWAIGLGLWVVFGLFEKKLKTVFSFSLVYAWLHITAPLLLVYGLIIKTYRWILRKKMSWRFIGLIILALVLGFTIQPNFPNNWFYFYLNGILVPFFAARWGVLELGAEFFPMNTSNYLFHYPLITLGLLSMLLISFLYRPRIKIKTQLMFLLAAMFVIMGMLSQRYIAHGYPFMILSLGMFFNDWIKTKSFKKLVKKLARGMNLIMFLSVGLIFLLLANTFNQLIKASQANTIVNQHYEQMGQYLSDNVPAGDLIFHANWSDSQYFIGLNPKNDYFVTLDPVYMWHKDKKTYALYRAVAFGQVEDPYAVLKNNFGVSYGYAGKNYFGVLVDQVRKDKRFTIVKEDVLGIIFKL
jgi:hypothetical protein